MLPVRASSSNVCCRNESVRGRCAWSSSYRCFSWSACSHPRVFLALDRVGVVAWDFPWHWSRLVRVKFLLGGGRRYA